MLLEELQRVVTSKPPDPEHLAECVENKIVDKHDHYLPDELLCENYASKQLDIEGAFDEVEKILMLDR